MFSFLTNAPWLRPALFTLTGIATLVKVLTPAHTIAHKAADWVLTAALPAAAGSLGQSNSGLAAAPKNQTP